MQKKKKHGLSDQQSGLKSAVDFEQTETER